MARYDTENLGSPTEVHIVTRAGTICTFSADEIITPYSEHGIVRLKLAGEAVGLMIANQVAG